MTGTATELRRACDPGPCWIDERTFDGRSLQLQSRADEGADRQTVATTASADGEYRFDVAFAASGDYRVVAAPVPWAGEFGFGYGETAATTVTGVTAPVTGGGPGSPGGGAGEGLPITGAPVMWVALAGVLLVTLGGGVAASGRLRRTS